MPPKDSFHLLKILISEYLAIPVFNLRKIPSYPKKNVAKTFVSISKKHLSFQPEIPHLYFVPNHYNLITLKQTPMRQMLKPVAFLLIAAFAITSCKKEVKESAQDQISGETLTKIYNHGFGTSNVQKIEEGYLVEGDIVLTEEFLNSTPGGYYLRVGTVEQYHTTNLVSGSPRTITVSSSGTVSAGVSAAIDAAIDRYNAEPIGLTFQRVGSGGDINIKIVNGGPYIASAGFPTSGGDPYNTVKFNRQYQNWQSNTLATIFAHEIGHCVGFRHSDFFDRSISCGGGASNEGASNVGAIWIPGTPAAPNVDTKSWMLACIGNGINRTFTNYDKAALDYLYP